MNTKAWFALLFAGSVFSFGGWGKVKDGVTINGVDVGGLPYAEAEKRVRAALAETLRPVVIHAPDENFVPQGLTVRDDCARLVRSAGRGEALTLRYTRQWADAEGELLALCARHAREAKDAELHFSAAGFSYTSEVLGLACDYCALLHDVGEALPRGGEVFLSRREYPPAVTEEALRERTRELSCFRTSFDGTNSARRHNIALAASRISGTVIAPHAEFSFNETVGKRTRENGFRVAAVILDGEFVPGVGGGVCQTSTTLFGAALRAGMEITESRAHSLAVGYVPPSQDAMVSDASDLKFVNPFDTPVYVLAEAGKGSVGFRFFGLPDGKRYEVASRVLERVPPPPPEEETGEEEGVLRAEKEGIKSESFLEVYGADGALLSRMRIRKDSYAPVRGKIAVKKDAAAPLPGADEAPPLEGFSG